MAGRKATPAGPRGGAKSTGKPAVRPSASELARAMNQVFERVSRGRITHDEASAEVGRLRAELAALDASVQERVARGRPAKRAPVANEGAKAKAPPRTKRKRPG